MYPKQGDNGKGWDGLVENWAECSNGPNRQGSLGTGLALIGKPLSNPKVSFSSRQVFFRPVSSCLIPEAFRDYIYRSDLLYYSIHYDTKNNNLDLRFACSYYVAQAA